MISFQDISANFSRDDIDHFDPMNQLAHQFSERQDFSLTRKASFLL